MERFRILIEKQLQVALDLYNPFKATLPEDELKLLNSFQSAFDILSNKYVNEISSHENGSPLTATASSTVTNNCLSVQQI
jgi:hypothetical protein